MSRNLFWKLVLIVLVLIWSFASIYPPNNRDLVEVFLTSAVNRDGNFNTNIVERLKALQKQNPEHKFANILEAAGTNDLMRYFPMFPEAKDDTAPNRYILNRLQREAAGKIKRGLDLQGGTSFLVGVDLSKAASLTNETTSAGATNATISQDVIEYRGQRILAQAVEVLRRRVDKFGVAEPLIQPAGPDRILIQLPGLSQEDKERAMRQIQKAAYLEFRLVHEDSARMIEQGMMEPGYEVLRVKQRPDRRTPGAQSYLVKKKPERGMTGKYIRNAMFSLNPMTGEPEIDFTLTSQGADLFSQITRENIKRQLAIVLDGELYSAPVIQSEINGRGTISGSFDEKEAHELAAVLENPLEAPVRIIESREVDPSLGRDTIRSGVKAAIIGVIAVAGFMLVYYLFAGLVANVALIMNVIILLGVMCSIGTTLTLPGIAGIVLTIGMAVDANVLIFERIREELAAGKSVRGALNAGYAKAFGTIFDSNLTTLIASVTLIFMGTGPVKGFGVTLTIGVTVSMFTALVVTRLIFDWLLDKGWLKTIPMLQIIHGTKIDFMRWAMPAFIASWTLILVGNGYGLFVRGHSVLGVDFAGGDEQTFSFVQKVETDQLRQALGEASVGEASITYQRDLSTGQENLRVITAFDTADKVRSLLQEKFPQAQFKQLSLAKVGAVVGREITRTAILAALVAMFGILVYVAFRYEFSFAVGAVVAIIHDILMTMGWFFLSGRELSAPIVAAVLTIIGFSINDTIVIFDRIREDLKLGVRGTFKEVMNQALNQTLSRTLITSGTVFLATLSLFIFGGGVVNDFAFTFLVGILTGTYSSIYIASAIVLWWHRGQRPQTGSQVKMEESAMARA